MGVVRQRLFWRQRDSLEVHGELEIGDLDIDSRAQSKEVTDDHQ